MTLGISRLAAFITLAVLLSYEVSLAMALRRWQTCMARPAHADLRKDWFETVSRQGALEILAVQTLRNALMSASVTASTAALGLMGTVTLAASSLHAKLNNSAASFAPFTPGLAMELVLLALLVASIVRSVMAVPYYNQAGFVGGVSVESDARKHWTSKGTAYVCKAGVLFSWAFRQPVLIAPVVAFMLHPFAGPVAALVVCGVLFSFDRFETSI